MRVLSETVKMASLLDVEERPSIISDVLLQPIRHTGIVDFPGRFKTLIRFPVVFITVKEFLPMAFVLVDGVALQPILILIIVLLAVTLPLICLIDNH